MEDYLSTNRWADFGWQIVAIYNANNESCKLVVQTLQPDDMTLAEEQDENDTLPKSCEYLLSAASVRM